MNIWNKLKQAGQQVQNRLNKLYHHALSLGNFWFPGPYRIAFAQRRVLKFIVAGGTGAVVNLSILFCLTDLLHVYYLLSSVVSFIVSVGVSFVLQKYWAFRDRTENAEKTRAVTYLVMQISNLGINTLLLYISVSIFGFWYLAAQVVISLLIAVSTYQVNRMLIFRNSGLDTK